MAHDGKVTISTALDNTGLTKDVKNLGSIVKKGAAGLAKAVTKSALAITAAFGTAALAITKQAVDSYADYQQLIGGVETLFKDSASKVVQYAEDAFYTVGMSANEYMETVTGFSASLISALAGDTAKAADVANMALTDMADNANKMGSPLESIKNAYQGFAKQNYTMLDNLKLGYGGTKTEMERLLRDAEKISGVKYDIRNLSDVYNAIHQIQKRMGITGTTAKEAEKTITGSAAMTKAAWKNVLTAIAGGGDIDKAIKNLSYSITKYFENIKPVVEQALSGIGTLIEQIGPMLVETLASSIIASIPQLMNAVYQMLMSLAKGVYNGVVALISGSTKTIEKQLNVTDSISEGFEAATEGAKDFTKANEDAKKSLAGFDEIQKIGNTESVDTGGTVPSGVINAEVALDDQVTPEIPGWFSTIVTIISEQLQPLREIDISPAVESFNGLREAVTPITATLFADLKWAYGELLVPLAAWTIEDVLPAFLDATSGTITLLDKSISALKPLGKWLLSNFLKPIAEWTGGVIVDVLSGIADGLTAVSDWISEHQMLVETIIIIIGSFAAAWLLVKGALVAWNAVTLIWNNIGAISTAVTTAFGAAVSFLTSPITLVTLAIGALIAIVVLLIKNWDDVKTAATKVWEGIKSVWGTVADWFKTYVTDPIGNFFKNMINGIIGFINGMMSAITDGINFVIRSLNKLSFDVPDWVPGIGGETWGFSIREVTPPQIPLLAKGAVLPANKPFLAMVGDQKHGTNVEAPLETIQEAVALVMEDMAASNIAGFEAVVSILREILEAILGIEIGDDVIGQAVARYNRKMAIARGGA